MYSDWSGPEMLIQMVTNIFEKDKWLKIKIVLVTVKESFWNWGWVWLNVIQSRPMALNAAILVRLIKHFLNYGYPT